MDEHLVFHLVGLNMFSIIVRKVNKNFVTSDQIWTHYSDTCLTSFGGSQQLAYRDMAWATLNTEEKHRLYHLCGGIFGIFVETLGNTELLKLPKVGYFA